MWSTMRSICFALLLLASSGSAFAQAQLDPGNPTSAKPAQPIPLDLPGWRELLTPQQCPEGVAAPINTCGDGGDDLHWGFDPFTQHLRLMVPEILNGPGNISTNTALTQNAWTNMYGAVGAHGYRPGLTAYIPRGTYVGPGNTITVASGSVSPSTYTVRVLIGTCLQTTGGAAAQQGILIVPQPTVSAGTAAGAVNGVNNVLTFSNSGTSVTRCVTPGMVAYDVTHPGAIASQIVVCSVTATTVTLTSALAYPSCTGSGFVTAPGVSTSDKIEFGFPVGYSVQSWPGSASVAFSIPYAWSATATSTGCLAAARPSNQQCEIFVELYTNDNGASVLSAGGQVTNPPYSTSYQLFRMNDNHGGL